MSFKSPLQRKDGSPFSKMTPHITHYIPVPVVPLWILIYVKYVWDKVGLIPYRVSLSTEGSI